MNKLAVLTALILPLASAQSMPALPLNTDLVREVNLTDLARKQLPVTISPNFQVQLTLPGSVDAVIGNKPGLVRVTVLPAPLDRYVFLDALQPQGNGDLTIFVNGKPIKFALTVDARSLSGVREYAVQDESKATQAAAPNSPLSPATSSTVSAPSSPNTTSSTAASAPSVASSMPAASTASGTSASTVPTTPPPLATTPVQPRFVSASVNGAPVEALFKTKRDGDSLIVEYTVKSLADKALVVRKEDLRVMGNTQALPLDHLRPSALSLLLPGRSITGMFRVQTPLNNVQLMWPLSNLSTRAHYAVQLDLSATR